MVLRKYRFGPAFDGGDEPDPPSNSLIGNTNQNIIIEEMSETPEQIKIPEQDINIKESSLTSDLIRVIDNTDLKTNNNTNIVENKMSENIEEKTNEEIIHKEINDVVIEKEEIVEDLKKETEQIKSEEVEIKKPILKKVEEKITKSTGWNENEEVKFGVFTFKSKSERTVFMAFIIPPLIISIISMIHVVSFFQLSNTLWLSWALAAAFEFASISALFALTALTKIKKNTIWVLFFAIVVMQVIGNMYHSYVHMDPSNLELLKLLSILGINAEALPWTLRILGFLQGGILPIVALTFIKAVVEYLSVNRKEE